MFQFIPVPGKRGTRKSAVLVRDLSGCPTYQELKAPFCFCLRRITYQSGTLLPSRCHISSTKYMRKLVVVFLVLVVVAAISVGYSTLRGYTSWFIVVPNASITLDGEPTSGRVHKTRGGASLYVTVDVPGTRHTYDLEMSKDGKAHVSGCARWVAPRFPVILTGDLNPPCFFAEPMRTDESASITSNSAKFITKDGRKLEAHR
jgi:hypothetical protein